MRRRRRSRRASITLIPEAYVRVGFWSGTRHRNVWGSARSRAAMSRVLTCRASAPANALIAELAFLS
jgi:hypothetical protein